MGLGNTDQIVGINTSALTTGAITTNATTAITLDVLAGGISHRSVTQTLTDTAGNPHTVTVETTTPTVTNVAVSRGGNSADLSKVYAATTTSTTYYCYDSSVIATDCANPDPWDGTSAFLASGCTDLPAQSAMSCPGLYNGTAVVDGGRQWQHADQYVRDDHSVALGWNLYRNHGQLLHCGLRV